MSKALLSAKSAHGIACPRWSARQNPSRVIPPKPICIQLTIGIIFPMVPWHRTAARRIYLFIPRSKWNLRYIPNTTCPINKKATKGAKLEWILWANWRPLWAWPRNHPTAKILVQISRETNYLQEHLLRLELEHAILISINQAPAPLNKSLVSRNYHSSRK